MSLFAGLWGLLPQPSEMEYGVTEQILLNSYLLSQKMMVDRHQLAMIYLFWSIGQGRDELK